MKLFDDRKACWRILKNNNAAKPPQKNLKKIEFEKPIRFKIFDNDSQNDDGVSILKN